MKIIITERQFKNVLDYELGNDEDPKPTEEYQYLYHATYKKLLKKIKVSGLDSSKTKRSWSSSVPGYIYLATDPDQAGSYAEIADEVPESYLDNIIILTIDTSFLDPNKLYIDRNNQNNDTFEYRGIIPWEAIVQVEEYY